MAGESSLSTSELVGASPAMHSLACQIETAARSDLAVLITGESGTGKELVARAIHLNSDRSERPFITLNCGALTETLLESELFGYTKGAFTGANQSHRGLFEAANTGTIFLDEIGEMSIGSQVRLLRVLQESAIRPVGSHTEINLDVRVIAATNRNLAQEITFGRFREDLFYRIAVLTMKTPSLRERAVDIPMLVEHFIEQISQRMKRSRMIEIEPEGVKALTLYTWPGNVRQLRHIIERLVAGSRGHLITGEQVRECLANASPASDIAPQIPIVFRQDESLDDFLDRTMLGLYSHVRSLSGSHSQAARLLKTDRISLYQRIERARQRINSHSASGNEIPLDQG